LDNKIGQNEGEKSQIINLNSRENNNNNNNNIQSPLNSKKPLIIANELTNKKQNDNENIQSNLCKKIKLKK
jgi:hypothetical protein